MSNFMKIRPVGAELFNADGRTDRHDEANGRFSLFWESALKNTFFYYGHRSRDSSVGIVATLPPL
jgi:hypothetical protein